MAKTKTCGLVQRINTHAKQLGSLMDINVPTMSTTTTVESYLHPTHGTLYT